MGDRDRVSIDVLIITALPLEFDHLLEVQAGLVDVWRDAGDHDLPHHRARLDGVRGPLEVAALRLTKAGGVETATEVMRYLPILQPKYLAMSGVCGGNPDDTVFGDVVIAERVIQHDEGKLKVSGFEGDLWTHQATKPWRHVAGGMDGKPAAGHHGYGVPDVEASQWWFLEQLEAGRNPRDSLDYQRYFSDSVRSVFMARIEQEQKLVRRESGAFVLTDEGRSALANYRLDRPMQITRLPYHVRFGVMCSGNAVQADGAFWARMKAGVRKAMAVDMEAFAVGHVATDHSLPFIVIKGVMDYAHPGKNDAYKPFAARTSAEVLCSFLRKVCVPSTPSVLSVSAPTAGGGAGGPQAELLAELDRLNAALASASKALARQLRAELERVLPERFAPCTSFGSEQAGLETTPARYPITAEGREAVRRKQTMRVRKPVGDGDPEPHHYLSMDEHPEDGMDRADEVGSIAADVLRIDPQHSKRLESLMLHARDRNLLPPHSRNFSRAERLQNVIDRLAEDPGFFTLVFRPDDDRLEILRKYFPGLRILLSVEDPDWLAIESKLATKLRSFYRTYYSINPEDASR